MTKEENLTPSSSSFIDRYENVKDNKTLQTDISSVSDSYKNNPFGHNVSMSQIFERIERLSSAIYLVTSHMPADEPLRLSLRTQSIALLQRALNVRHGFQSSGIDTIQSLQAALREIVSLISIGTSGRFISPRNAHVIIRALDDTATIILQSQRTEVSEEVRISAPDLIPRTSPPLSRHEHRKAILSVRDKRHASKSVEIEGSVKDSHTDKLSRSERLISFLRTGGSFGIKDISLNMPEYSEKMIQRELNKLVSYGSVKKEGLKRWSRYSAA